MALKTVTTKSVETYEQFNLLQKTILRKIYISELHILTTGKKYYLQFVSDKVCIKKT
jgi:hypothetical protein